MTPTPSPVETPPLREGPARAVSPTVRALARHIGVVLAIKVVAILMLFLFFFSPSHRPDIDPAAMEGKFGVKGSTAANPPKAAP